MTKGGTRTTISDRGARRAPYILMLEHDLSEASRHPIDRKAATPSKGPSCQAGPGSARSRKPQRGEASTLRSQLEGEARRGPTRARDRGRSQRIL